MTEETKSLLVQSMTDETQETVIAAFLEMAGDALYKYADPYGMRDKAAFLDQYGDLQVRAAAYFLNKRGADGEMVHGENGTSRHYEAGDLPPSLLRELVPVCGVVQ